MLVNRCDQKQLVWSDDLCSTSCFAMDLVLSSPGKSTNSKSEPAPTSFTVSNVKMLGSKSNTCCNISGFQWTGKPKAK